MNYATNCIVMFAYLKIAFSKRNRISIDNIPEYSFQISNTVKVLFSFSLKVSLFANDFSRVELQTLIPGLTKWRIDQARQHTTKAGKGQVVPEKTNTRERELVTQRV